MRITIPVGPFRLMVIAQRYQRVRGITSPLPDGRHVLMWDFDDVPLEIVRASLSMVSNIFHLSEIVIVRTGVNSYHALEFGRHSWPRVLAVLAATPHLDQGFFKMGVVREYFTLRFSRKSGRKPQVVGSVPGWRRRDVDPRADLQGYVEYWTAKR